MNSLDPLTGFDIDLWVTSIDSCNPYTYEELSNLSWKKLKGLAKPYCIPTLNTEDVINNLLERKVIK
jgi:hypothetical protein